MRPRFLGHINEILVNYLKKLRSVYIMKRTAPATDNDLPRKKVLLTDNTEQIKVKKKMYAVLMMYSGVGYYGMQRNSGFPTIEGEVIKALHSCGYMDEVTPEGLKQLPGGDRNVVGKLNNVLPEEVRIIVIGQSFMLHQIRKMIGLAFAIVRGHATEEAFETVFGKARMDVPKAPGLGLLLKEVAYDRYNERFGKDGIHKPVTWDPYQEQIDRFQLKYIYNHIDQTEVEEESMLRWLESLELHRYSYRERGKSPVSPPSLSSPIKEKVTGEEHTLVNQLDEEAGQPIRVSM